MAGQCVVEEVTTQHSICAVVALYKDDQVSSPRVAGPGPTMLALTCAAMGGCVKILNSLQSQYIIIISKLYHLIKSIF